MVIKPSERAYANYPKIVESKRFRQLRKKGTGGLVLQQAFMLTVPESAATIHEYGLAEPDGMIWRDVVATRVMHVVKRLTWRP